jgi:hypothetical protein
MDTLDMDDGPERPRYQVSRCFSEVSADLLWRTAFYLHSRALSSMSDCTF